MSKDIESLEMKSVKVSEQTYGLLAEIGKYNESMDDIIKRVVIAYIDDMKNKK